MLDTIADTIADTDFDAAYQEILAEHIAGDCPEDCAFCLEDGHKSPIRLGHPASKPPAVAGYRLTFGRHKGKLLSEVPGDYLNWVLKADSSDSKSSRWMHDAKQAIRHFRGETRVSAPPRKKRRGKNKSSRAVKTARRALAKDRLNYKY